MGLTKNKIKSIDNSRTTNSIRNILTGVVGQIIQIIMGFIVRTIFIKSLEAEYLGINGLFTNILSILSLAELGVGSAIIYALYKPIADDDKKHIKILMNFYGKVYKIIGIVVTILGIAFLPFLNFIIKDAVYIKENIYSIYLFYLFNTVITYFYSYKNSIIVAYQKNYIVSLINYGMNFIQVLIQIFVLIISKNFLLYLLTQSICIFTNNFIIAKVADKLYPFLKENQNESLSKKDKKSLITNIKALMIIKISGVLVNNTDNLIISYFSGLSSIGYVSNYNMIISAINTAILQIFNGLTASVGNLNVKENKEKKVFIFNIINLASFWIIGLASISIILVINDIIRLWAGEKYVLEINIVIALILNFYMMGMQNVINTFKNTMGLFLYGKYILLITATINLILSIVLGKIWGMFGIFISTAIARLLTNVWYHPYIVYKYGLEVKFTEYISRYLYYIILLISSTLITGYFCSKVFFASILTIIIKMALCLIIPNLIFILCFYKTKEFKYLKELFITKFNRFSN